MKEVKVVLAFALLKRLLKVTHLVKENILLGRSLVSSMFLTTGEERFREPLYLTKTGLIVKSRFILVPLNDPKLIDADIINEYGLNHKELKEILQELESGCEQRTQ